MFWFALKNKPQQHPKQRKANSCNTPILTTENKCFSAFAGVFDSGGRGDQARFSQSPTGFFARPVQPRLPFVQNESLIFTIHRIFPKSVSDAIFRKKGRFFD